MEFTVSIPLDDEGFLDRQCHADQCGRYFKVLHSDWEAIETDAITCPFCGAVDEPNAFTTAEQQDYLQQAAHAFAQEQIQKMLSGFAKGVNRRSSRSSPISINVTTKFSRIAVPVAPDALESMRMQIRCDSCHVTFAVVGAGFFCPACGKNSAHHTFLQAVGAIRGAAALAGELANRTNDQDAAEARRVLLEDQIENLVTTFQRFGEEAYAEIPNAPPLPGRNVFQRLADASAKWQAAGGKAFESVLAPTEWGELLTYFQKRHLLSHKDGFVDADYVQKSGDTTYRVGQRLVVSESQVLRMADLVEKLGRAMQADVPSAPPSVTLPMPATRPPFPPKLPGTTDRDWQVFRIICETAIHEPFNFLGDREEWNEASRQGFSETEFADAAAILRSKGLIDTTFVLDGRRVPATITLTGRGLELFFTHAMPDHLAERKRIARLVLDEITDTRSLAEQTGHPLLFIQYVVEDFERRGWISDIMWAGDSGYVHVVDDVFLRRFADG